MITAIGEEVRILYRGAEMICEMVQRIAKDRGVNLDKIVRRLALINSFVLGSQVEDDYKLSSDPIDIQKVGE